MTRTYWTDDQVAILRELYPDHRTAAVAEVIGRPEKSTYAKANQLGLKKSAAFLASEKSGRMQRGRQDPRMTATQFKPGLVPWNKGTHYVAGGRSAQTRFRPGQKPATWLPVGSMRILKTHQGPQLEMKMNDDPGPNHVRWWPYQRVVWLRAGREIPPGHFVVFKPGMKTLDPDQVTLDRIECIDRKQLARRNHPGNKSPELAKLVQLKGAITRQVNRIQREANEQHQRTA